MTKTSVKLFKITFCKKIELNTFYIIPFSKCITEFEKRWIFNKFMIYVLNHNILQSFVIDLKLSLICNIELKRYIDFYNKKFNFSDEQINFDKTDKYNGSYIK